MIKTLIISILFHYFRIQLMLSFFLFLTPGLLTWDTPGYDEIEILEHSKILNESCTDMDKAVQCELDTTDVFIGLFQ